MLGSHSFSIGTILYEEPAVIDHHRPVYHFLPERNWMNDPNGLIQHNGVYHVFYQHNPHGALWGNMSWGHARSTDLVHWQHLPIAIRPDADGPDADGCYSGVMVVHQGTPTMVYTGVRSPNELCCLAMPEDDDLIVWEKYAGNPVIPAPPPGVPVTIFRDHTLWREGDIWYMGVGSGIEGQGGAVLLYRSPDLRMWEYLHPLAIEQPELNDGGQLVSTGWECPDYFFIQDEPVLLTCEWDGDPISSSWWRGSMQDHHFEATSRGLTDAGDTLYAPQTFLAEDGRRIFFGWMRELRGDDQQVVAGWSGVLSLPREVELRGDGTVGFRPASEVRKLRGARRDFQIQSGALPTSAACEIHLVSQGAFSLQWGGQFSVSWSGDVLTVRSAERTMIVTLPGDTPEIVDVDIFIDHSLVEVYLADQVVLSTRVYADVHLWDEATLESDMDHATSVSVWEITPIW